MRNYFTHHRAFFSIVPDERPDGQVFWSSLIKRVGEWLFDRYRNINCNRTSIIKPWLFLGGDWFSDLPDTTAETKAFHGDAPTGDPPRYWTFRLQERDPDHKERFWRTDLGITSVDNLRFDVAITLSYFIIPGHFAAAPPEPVPAASSLLDVFFDLDRCRVQCGNYPLYAFAQPLQAHQVEAFVKILADTNRQHLLVLVRADEKDDFGIDVERLAELFVGNGNVYYYHGYEVENDLQHHLHVSYAAYYCPSDSAKIYQTQLDCWDPRDAMRHRHFRATHFPTWDALAEVISKGLQYRKDPPFNDFVAFREDIFHRLDRLGLASVRWNSK